MKLDMSNTKLETGIVEKDGQMSAMADFSFAKKDQSSACREKEYFGGGASAVRYQRELEHTKNIDSSSILYRKPEENGIIGNVQNSTILEKLDSDMVIDSDTKRQQMAVLANIVTPEDLRKMQEEGYSIASTEAATFVSVVDKIKINMALTGGNVSADISDEQLEKVVGNEYLSIKIKETFQNSDLPLNEKRLATIKAALEMYQNIKPIHQEAAMYLVKNNCAPTIENIYKAEHSIGIDSWQKNVDWSQLQKQIRQVISETGFDVTEETMQSSQELIKNDVPLTKENLRYYWDLLHTSFLSKGEKYGDKAKDLIAADQFVHALSNAIQEGKDPVEAVLLSGYSDSDRAEHAASVIGKAESAHIEICLRNQWALNIENLSFAQAEGLGSPYGQSKGQNLSGGQVERRAETTAENGGEIRLVEAQRILEEARLYMTAEANLKLLKRGISIDTKPLEEIVDALKSMEKTYYKTIFHHAEVAYTEDRVDTLKNIEDAMKVLRGAPAEILGRIESPENTTLKSLYQMAVSKDSISSRYELSNSQMIKSRIQHATLEYEKLWTSPRADLGDSLENAFQNVDDILGDLGLDVEHENRRAVRILVYNRMDITPENVNDIREKDEIMQQLFTNLTPRITLELIRDGRNPMDIPIEQLNREIIGLHLKNEEKTGERFERFLHKLDKSHQISNEEKNSFIGIYRLIAQIQKSDAAAVGAVVRQGSVLTMRNLLTQLRNINRSQMDYKIDDKFSGVDIHGLERKIDDQIESAFHKELFEQDDSLDYEIEQLHDIERASNAPEKVYERLEAINIPADVESVLSMQMLMESPQAVLTKVLGERRYRKAVSENEVHGKNTERESILSQFKEALDEPEKLVDVADSLKNYAGLQLKNVIEEVMPVNSFDIKAMRLVSKQMAIAARQSRTEQYLIPLETGNGEIAGISLKIVRGTGIKGQVAIQLDYGATGKMFASFAAREIGIEGMIVCEDEFTRRILEEQMPLLAEDLSFENEEPVALSLAVNPNLSFMELSAAGLKEKPSGEASGETHEVQTKRLYEIAKRFILFVGKEDLEIF